MKIKNPYFVIGTNYAGIVRIIEVYDDPSEAEERVKEINETHKLIGFAVTDTEAIQDNLQLIKAI